nr:transcription initiation factor TFIID subunit 6 [Drosophila bipectinata]
MNSPHFPTFDENFCKKLVSRKSLEAICMASTGRKLDDKVAKWLSLKAKEKMEKLLNEAGKVSRRSRDSQMKVSHLQYAVRTDENLPANIFFRLVPVRRNLPRTEKQRSRRNLVPVPEPISNRRALVSVDHRAQVTPSMAGLLRKKQVLLKPCGIYTLTKEQQNFYELITNVGVSYSEIRRKLVFRAMSKDPSMEVLLPSLSQFISESTVCNIGNKKVHMLLYTMRMVRALIRNPRCSLYKYLHKILPAVLSCLLVKDHGRESKEHWALREYSGNIMAEIVRTFGSTDSSILSRVLSVYKRALTMEPLTTVFGAVIGLGKLGNYAVRACLVPQIAYLSRRIDPYLATSADTTSSELDKQASKYIRHRLVKVCTPVIKNVHSVPGVVEEFIAAYGSLGEPLCHAVTVSRVKDMVTIQKRGEKHKVAKKRRKKPSKELSKKLTKKPENLPEKPSKELFKKPSKQLSKESSQKLSKITSPSKKKSIKTTRTSPSCILQKRKSSEPPDCISPKKKMNGTVYQRYAAIPIPSLADDYWDFRF